MIMGEEIGEGVFFIGTVAGCKVAVDRLGIVYHVSTHEPDGLWRIPPHVVGRKPEDEDDNAAHWRRWAKACREAITH